MHRGGRGIAEIAMMANFLVQWDSGGGRCDGTTRHKGSEFVQSPVFSSVLFLFELKHQAVFFIVRTVNGKSFR